MFSYMDGLNSYNQVKIEPLDVKNTTFLTSLYQYRRSFRTQKYAGATYKRATTAISRYVT